MKKALIILFVFQYTGIVLSFSQGEAVKPATDACPTWNKKQSTNKLAFYNAANKKSNSKEVKENNEEKKADEGDASEEEEEFEKFDIYTAEELALMSTFNLQKLKMEYSTKSGKRKTAIKAKGTLMKEEKKMQLENEISELEKMIVLVDAELAKRKETE